MQSKKHQRGKYQLADEAAVLPYLPHEIIVEEILTRLPVKSLYRFRCVSKSWHCLISLPRFIKLHLNRALENNRSNKLIFSSSNNCYLEYEPVGQSNTVTDADDVVATELDLPFTVDPRNCLKIVRSCNGLLCMAPDEYNLLLYNPSTRDTKRIPDLGGSSSRYWSAPSHANVYGFGYDSTGFGYDSTADDFKVVRVVCGAFVVVYSLRANSWRWVGLSPYDYTVYESGILLNGSLHWMATHGGGKDEEYELVVAAFELATERFWHMPAPDFDDAGSEFVLGVLFGCLCVLHYGNQMQDDFWLMNEYGVGESWTRFRISLSYAYMKPLHAVNNAKTLLEIDGRLVLYDFEQGTYKNLVVHGIPHGAGFKVFTYMDSFISPNTELADY